MLGEAEFMQGNRKERETDWVYISESRCSLNREFGPRTLVTHGEQMNIKRTILQRPPCRCCQPKTASTRCSKHGRSSHLPDQCRIGLFISTSRRFPVESVRRHMPLSRHVNTDNLNRQVLPLRFFATNNNDETHVTVLH